jgi:hypothetical protein
MSKKTNTLWFILGATVFNLLVTVICFVALLLLYVRVLAPLFPDPENAAAWGFPLVFIAAIVLSFVVYRVLLKQLTKRVNIDKHFDPIFGPHKPPKRD